MSLDLDKSTWKRVSFGDVVDNVNETVRDADAAGIDRIIAMEHMDPGELKISRWGSPEDGTTFTRRVKPGQTLFGKRRAYQRKVAYAEFEAICSGDIYTLEADETQLLGEFLPFLVQSNEFFDHALDTSAGSLSPRTNWRDLANFEFDLPPLDEQKRLADLLWAVERHRDALGAVDQALRVTARETISEVRRTAPEKTLGDVVSVRSGYTFPKSLQGRPSGEIAFFKVADLDGVGNERYLTAPQNWVSSADAEQLGATPFPAGTVVTARVGAAIKLERRRALAFPALVDDNNLVIRPTGIHKDFLLAILTETRLADMGNEGVVPSLNQRIINAVPAPSLTPDREERVGVAYRILTDARDGVAGERHRLNELRSALLTDIFRGN